MAVFYSCFFILLLLFLNINAKFVESCYEGTDYWSGKKTGNKRNCDPETKYCYILMGSSATSRTSGRGCSPDYIDTYCEKYRANPSSATEFCFSIHTFDMNGKLCCCNSHSNCNSVSAITVSQLIMPLFLSIIFYVLMFFTSYY